VDRSTLGDGEASQGLSNNGFAAALPELIPVVVSDASREAVITRSDDLLASTHVFHQRSVVNVQRRNLI
jgi:hypothetical protein